MGEAKRKRLAGTAGVTTVYHHTSILRTNLIWMSGVIEVEGKMPPAFHPQLGEIRTDARVRRSMEDFPPVAWFTSKTHVPQCLQDIEFRLVTNDDNRTLRETRVPPHLASAFSLQRLALGFPVEGSTIIPWRDYYGFSTPEGRELNRTAQAVGDNPNDWWVSETPVDVLTSTEVWVQRQLRSPRLENYPPYLADVHKMVRLCRDRKDAYIPPAWVPEAKIRELAARTGIGVADD